MLCLISHPLWNLWLHKNIALYISEPVGPKLRHRIVSVALQIRDGPPDDGESIPCSNATFAITKLRARSWLPRARWTRRSVTFCGTWWLRGPSSEWCACKCQSAGTLGRSPFSSGWRLSSGLRRSSPALGAPCFSGRPSLCCSRCWPELKQRQTSSTTS